MSEMTEDDDVALSAWDLAAPEWMSLFLQASEWCSVEDDPKPVPEMFDKFMPYACNLCKRNPIMGVSKLNRCSRCKIVRYCCNAHQKRDWKRHKHLCAAMTAVQTKLLAAHAASCDTEDGARRWADCLQAVQPELAKLAPEATELHSVAISTFPLQAHCRSCFAPGVSTSLETCSKCHSVAFCSACREAGQEAVHSDEECHNHIVSLTCMGLVSDFGSPLMTASQTPCDEPKIPGSWREYLALNLDDFHLPVAMVSMANTLALLTEGLSAPMTALYALRLAIGREQTQTMSSLCLHVVGAATFECIGIRVYAELSHLLPNLEEIHIVFVGPQVALAPCDRRDETCLIASEIPMRETCRLYVTARQLCYHECSDLPKPSLVILPNSGLHDLNYTASWAPTLASLKAMQVPCCFTSFSLSEADKDMAVIQDAGLAVTHPVQLNPFRSLRPCLETPVAVTLEKKESFFYFCNSHLCMASGAS